MAIDSPKKPFSKRYGYKSQPKEITVWEDAPESLRHFVLDTAIEMGFGPYPLRDAICSVLHTRPHPGNWSEYPNVWGEAEGLVYGCEWFHCYDFVEKVYQEISKQRSNEYPMNHEVVVIGAGIGGATVALALRKLGLSVTLIEERDDILLGASLIPGRLHYGGMYLQECVKEGHIESAAQCPLGEDFCRGPVYGHADLGVLHPGSRYTENTRERKPELDRATPNGLTEWTIASPFTTGAGLSRPTRFEGSYGNGPVGGSTSRDTAARLWTVSLRDLG